MHNAMLLYTSILKVQPTLAQEGGGGENAFSSEGDRKQVEPISGMVVVESQQALVSS